MKHISEVASTEPDGSAGVPPAVPSASSGQAAGAFRPRFGEVTIRDRGRLPHWEQDGATYFITFRLVDSLPKSVLDRIESERRAIVTTANQLQRDLSADERRKIQRLSTPAIEQFLDNGAGACHLQNPVIAEALANTLRHFSHGASCQIMSTSLFGYFRARIWRLWFIPGSPSARNTSTEFLERMALFGKGNTMITSFEARKSSNARFAMSRRIPPKRI